MPDSEYIGLKFNDRDAFGNFCVALHEERIQFNLGGFQTLIITKEQLKKISRRLKKLSKELEDKNIIVMLPMATTSSGRRYLPTVEETEAILRDLTENYGR